MCDLSGLTVLCAEDDGPLCDYVRTLLELDGATVVGAGNGEVALQLMAQNVPDILVSDVRMPVMDGLALARHARERYPGLPVILCTAFTETDCLLEAIELGVSAFVRKPLDYEILARELARLAVPIRQRREIERLEGEVLAPFTRALGSSPLMRGVAEQVQRAAASDYAILLQGETGSGKSHLARLIHDASARRRGAFVVANLGAIAETLAETELFGHVRGAFTGAGASRLGLFRQAEGGTLFIDDIDTTSDSVQAKILLAVESHQVLPLGADLPIPVDVRIITASNRDLNQGGAAHCFRRDLYYRLSDLVITTPPLRERRDDIIPMALSFLRESCDELGRPVPGLNEACAAPLLGHDWPGNIRELKSLMRRVAVFAGEALEPGTLPGMLSESYTAEGCAEQAAPPAPKTQGRVLTLEQAERAAIASALAAAGGQRMEAARLLNIDYQRFKRKVEKLGVAC